MHTWFFLYDEKVALDDYDDYDDDYDHQHYIWWSIWMMMVVIEKFMIIYMIMITVVLMLFMMITMVMVILRCGQISNEFYFRSQPSTKRTVRDRWFKSSKKRRKLILNMHYILKKNDEKIYKTIIFRQTTSKSSAPAPQSPIWKWREVRVGYDDNHHHHYYLIVLFTGVWDPPIMLLLFLNIDNLLGWPSPPPSHYTMRTILTSSSSPAPASSLSW